MSTGLARNISALYFGYRPVAGHAEACRFRGTDMWEVTRHTWENFDGTRTETTTRYACHDCGVIRFESTGGEGCRECGEVAGDKMSFEGTHASQVGYGSKPEKVAGAWLHPGPRIWHGDERGPTAYYVTATRERPRQPDDVLGVVGWHLGRRGGVRWDAGAGCTGHGTVKVSASESAGDFGSRRAAVAWVAGHAEQPA